MDTITQNNLAAFSAGDRQQTVASFSLCLIIGPTPCALFRLTDIRELERREQRHT